MTSGLSRSLPNYPFVVVDQHILRNRKRLHDLFEEYDRTGQRLVLSHSAYEELSQGSWQGALQRLEVLFERPDTVHVLNHHVMTYHRHEGRYRSMAPYEAIIDKQSTWAFGALAHALGSGQLDEETFALEHEKEKKRIARALTERGSEVLYRRVPGESFTFANGELKEINRGLQLGDRGPLRDSLMQSFTRENLADMLRGSKFPFRTATKLCAFPSMTVLALLTVLTIAFDLRVRNEFATTKSSPSNDDADAENIIMALYGRGLVSDDKKACDRLDDVRYFVKQIWG